jgi:hypothetical protein
MWREVVAPVAVTALLLAIPQVAWAYIGPGVGITMIGSLFALLAAIMLALTALVWYPLKRLRAKARAKRREREEAAPS